MRLAALFLLSSLLLAAPARAGWEIGAAATAGVRPDSGGAGGFGSLSFGYRIPVGVDILARLGVGAFSEPTELVIPIELEARHRFVLMAHDRVQPFVSGSFIHAHEVPWGSFKEEPVASIAGTCDCINHRTGLMASGGVLYKPFQALPLDAGARLSFTALLPHVNGPTFYLTASLSLDWVF